MTDRIIKVSDIGKDYKTCIYKEIQWSEFVKSFKNPKVGNETLEEYSKLPKDKRDKLKNVGGYVGGVFKDNTRKKENLLSRSLITLDLDNIEANTLENVYNKIDLFIGSNSYLIHSSRNHSVEAPRLRLIIPLDRDVNGEEYEAIARKIGELIGFDLCDKTTFEPSRLMYYPSQCKGADYVYKLKEGELLKADAILGKYDNWQDKSAWKGIDKDDIYKSQVAKQQDPLTKEGPVGEFCRAYYPIGEAIAELLSDVYSPCDIPNRYTYIKGSTTAGAVIYDDKFLYSHHQSDPVNGKLCNAFDLVRIHKFGHLDEGIDANTNIKDKPSFKDMVEFANSLEKVKHQKHQKAIDIFGTPTGDKENLEWVSKLSINTQNGNTKATIKNAKIILENDLNLKGKFAYNEFSLRNMIKGELPWDKNDKLRPVEDSDESGLRLYYEDVYKMTRATNVIKDAFALVLKQNKYHPVKEYLESLKWDGVNRIDNFLSEFLGADNNDYTKACARIFMCGGVARIYNPGCQHDYVMTLVGEQGIRKSTFFMLLAKNTDWFVELKTIDPKRSVEETMGKWIVEMSELAAAKKKEDEEIKAFITNKTVTVRLSYARHPTDVPRQFVLAGTTNEYNYLKDPTGNRRHLPIDCNINKATKSIYKDLESEVDQLWAEAKEIYKKLGNESLYLSDKEEELAIIEQDKHRIVDDEEGSIIEFLNTPLPLDWYDKPIQDRLNYFIFLKSSPSKPEDTFIRDRICVKELSYELYGNKTVDRKESIRLNKILEGLKDWEKQKTSIRIKGYGSQRGYYRK